MPELILNAFQIMLEMLENYNAIMLECLIMLEIPGNTKYS